MKYTHLLYLLQLLSIWLLSYDTEASHPSQYNIDSLYEEYNKVPAKSKEAAFIGVKIGNYYAAKDLIDSATYYYYNALTTAEEKNLVGTQVIALNGLAIMYADMHEYEKALDYYYKALKLSTNEVQVRTIYTNIGTIYNQKKEYEKAIEHFDLAEQTINSDSAAVINIYINKANSLAMLKKHDESVKLLYAAIRIANKYDSIPVYLGGIRINIASNQLRNQKATHETKQLLLEAVEIGKANQIPSLLESAFSVLIDYHLFFNDYENAFEYLFLKDSVENVILNEQKLKQIAELQQQYENLQKDKALLQKELEIKELQYARNKQLSIIGLLIALLIITGAISSNLYLRNRKRATEKKLVEYQLQETLLKQEELNSLLELQNKKLLRHSLEKAHQQEILQEVEEYAQKSGTLGNKQLSDSMQRIKQLVAAASNVEQNWEEFKLRFEQVHLNFFDILQKKYNNLTDNDLKMCAFIKLQLDRKQIASMLNVTPKAIEVARYRLKKKLNLGAEDDLNKFINQIE